MRRIRTHYPVILWALLAWSIAGCAADLTPPAPEAATAPSSSTHDLVIGGPSPSDACTFCEGAHEVCLAGCIDISQTRSQLAACQDRCDAAFDACWTAAQCDEPPDDEVCPVVASALDVNVPRVQISGDFTVNNATPVPYDSQTAHIELRNETLGVVDLGSVHYGSYSRWIIPGIYDVVYLHTEGDLLPQNAETVLFEDVDLTATGTFDIPIESVLVMGDIFVNGAPAPASVYENGEVRLRDRDTGASFPVGQSYDGMFMAMVIPGDYDVMWSRLLGGSEVPVNSDALIVEDVAVAGLTEIDVDIPAVLRTGEFRFNNQLAPASIYENGQMYLRDTVTGDVFAFGMTKNQSYSTLVVPGTYDVIYSRLLGSTVAPSNEFAVVSEAVDMLADGDLDINIPVAGLEGTLSLDGADFPAGVYDRARFWLQGEETDDVFSIGTTETSAYDTLIIPGTYDVVYEVLLSNGAVPENEWSVVSTANSLVPPKGWLLTGQPITFDIAVSSGWLGADVTVWGAAPLHSVYNNGDILALDATGDIVQLGSIFDGGGSARLLAGPYAYHYAHINGDYVPANGNAHVGDGATNPVLTPDAVDLQQGDLSGVFSQGGVAFPADAFERGVIGLRDVETGDLVELGNSDDGGYDRLLLSGTYEVVYDQVNGDQVVGNRNATLGCVTFAPEPPAPEGAPGDLLANTQ